MFPCFTLAAYTYLAAYLSLPAVSAMTGIASAPVIDKLVSQLGDRDFQVRQKASRALLALGAPALAELQKLRSQRDAEVGRRVDGLIASLERAAALTPKRITLHLQKKPIRDVLAEMAKQTGFKIPTSDPSFNTPAGKALYSFDFDRTPFWEALDKVCETTGLQQQLNRGNDTLQLSFQDNYEPFRCYDGAFKVTATGFHFYRNTNLAFVSRNPGNTFNQDSENLQLSLTVAVEPRLPILKLGQVKLLAAEDDQNCSMLANFNYENYYWGRRYYYGGQQRSFFQQTSVSMSWPAKSSRTVKRVKGIIPVTLLADQKSTLVTDNLLSSKGKKFQVGSATFAIDDISNVSSNQQQIKISYMEGDSDNPYDYNRIRSVQQRLEIQDASGRKYPSYVRSFFFNGPGSATFQMYTQAPPKGSKLGPPAKLVYQVWVQMEHEVPFEFKNLPLP
jgi:hypothetical protein